MSRKALAAGRWISSVSFALSTAWRHCLLANIIAHLPLITQSQTLPLTPTIAPWFAPGAKAKRALPMEASKIRLISVAEPCPLGSISPFRG
jgi:hypothetical protein